MLSLWWWSECLIYLGLPAPACLRSVIGSTVSGAGYCDKVGDLSNRNLFSNSSAGSTSKVTVSAGLVSPETFLLGLQMVAFLLGLHAVAPWSVSSSPLLTRIWVILNKAHPYDLILPYLPLYRPCPKYSHMLQTKGLGLKRMNLERGA